MVISDLTMPKLDGYGLLKRIRASKIRRIRNMPVVVVSGSDEQAERDRAKAAGATDLITKGIGTGQLLSRLDILSKLVSTQNEFERGLEALVHSTATDDHVELPSPQEWAARGGRHAQQRGAPKSEFRHFERLHRGQAPGAGRLSGFATAQCD